MKELIKSNNLSFTAGTRAITVSDSRSFTKYDILAIVNETQKVVIFSAGKYDNVVSVASGVITYASSLPVLAAGDIVRVSVDFPQNSLQAPEFKCNVHFTSLSVAFKCPQTGALTSFGDVSNLKVKRAGSTTWTPVAGLPINISDSDFLYAECAAGCDEELVIQLTSSTGAEINPGTLGSKIINGVSRYAGYSTAKGKVVIIGLSLFDEAGLSIVGDGNTYGETGTYSASRKWNKNLVEYNGYSYFYSAERAAIIRVNMATNETSVIQAITFTNTHSFVNIGTYVYFFNGSQLLAINTTDLSVVTVYSTSSANQIPCSVISDGTSLYANTYTAGIIHKVNGISLTDASITGSTGMLAESGLYLYLCFGSTIKKITKSDMTLYSSITSNVNATVMDCVCYNDYLYTVFGTGQITKLDLSTFSSPSVTLTTSISCNSADIKLYNGHLYILLGDTNKFVDYNLSTDTFVINTLVNTHNCMNLDSVNGRLIFYTVNKNAGITLYPVEIVTI